MPDKSWLTGTVSLPTHLIFRYHLPTINHLPSLEREKPDPQKKNQSVLWILNPGVSDLYSFDTDPDPVRIQSGSTGFDDQKL